MKINAIVVRLGLATIAILPSKAVIADSAVEAMFKWQKCVRQAVEQFAQSTQEPAEVVLSGSFGICINEEKAYKRWLIEAAGSSSMEVQERISRELREHNREILIGIILQSRSKGIEQ